MIDPDQGDSPNSTVTLSVVSQSPQVPKMDLHQIDPRMAQLTFKGCFDYDVSVTDFFFFSTDTCKDLSK